MSPSMHPRCSWNGGKYPYLQRLTPNVPTTPNPCALLLQFQRGEHPYLEDYDPNCPPPFLPPPPVPGVTEWSGRGGGEKHRRERNTVSTWISTSCQPHTQRNIHNNNKILTKERMTKTAPSPLPPAPNPQPPTPLYAPDAAEWSRGVSAVTLKSVTQYVPPGVPQVYRS